MPQITIGPAISALLLMDARPTEGDRIADGLYGDPSILALKALLAAARRRGLLVVHARPTDATPPQTGRLGRTWRADAATADDPGMPPPLLSEPVVDTDDCPSLQRTQLERILVSGGIRTVVLAGRTNALHLAHVLGPVLEGKHRCLLVDDTCPDPEPKPRGSALKRFMDEMDGRAMAVASSEVLAALGAPEGAMTEANYPRAFT